MREGVEMERGEEFIAKNEIQLTWWGILLEEIVTVSRKEPRWSQIHITRPLFPFGYMTFFIS